MSNIQITETNTRQPAKGFAIVPSSILRDPHLSLGAKALYGVIDSHQGDQSKQQLKIATLAGELGISDRTTRRYITELKAAGHLTTKVTMRSSVFTVINPSRRPKLTADSPAKVIPRSVISDRTTRSPVTGLKSINPLSNKKACTQEIPTITVEITETRNAAAKSGTDSLTLEQFRDLLPEQIRPRPETHLANTLAAALERGWTVQGLALAVKAEIHNPQAGPGLTVKILRQLSQRPPDEYGTPDQYRDNGYGDMCEESLIRATRQRASRREYSEPMRVSAGDYQRSDFDEPPY